MVGKSKICEVARHGFFLEQSKFEQISKHDELLKSFMNSNKEWVHPNVLKMVESGDLEGTNMALNQIHYLSLQSAREAERLRKLALRNQYSEDTHKNNKRMEPLSRSMKSPSKGNQGWIKLGDKKRVDNFIMHKGSFSSSDYKSISLNENGQVVANFGDKRYQIWKFLLVRTRPTKIFCFKKCLY